MVILSDTFTHAHIDFGSSRVPLGPSTRCFCGRRGSPRRIRTTHARTTRPLCGTPAQAPWSWSKHTRAATTWGHLFENKLEGYQYPWYLHVHCSRIKWGTNSGVDRVGRLAAAKTKKIPPIICRVVGHRGAMHLRPVVTRQFSC